VIFQLEMMIFDMDTNVPHPLSVCGILARDGGNDGDHGLRN